MKEATVNIAGVRLRMNPDWPGSSFTDLQIPWSVTKAPKNAFKPDTSRNRNADPRVSFSPKSEASYPLFKDLASRWLRISNCSRDLLKYRGCSEPWGCRLVDSLRPPPCNRNTGTAVCKKNTISCFFTLRNNSHLTQGSNFSRLALLLLEIPAALLIFHLDHFLSSTQLWQQHIFPVVTFPETPATWSRCFN